MVAAGISTNINHDGCRKLLNRIGAKAVGVIFVHWPIDDEDIPAFAEFVDHRVLVLAALTLFCLLEVDRINGEAKVEEAKNLSCGFSGSIAQATCSKQADAERIFREIGEKTENVDYAIHVLLAAGMSSPTLREIARRGINVRGAGHAEIAVAFVALVPLTCESLWSIYCDVVYLPDDINIGFVPVWLMHGITVVARLGLLFLLWQKPRDERCFILKMMSKILVLYLIICCPLLADWETQRSEVRQFRRWFALPLTLYSCTFGLACTLLAVAFLVQSHPKCNAFVLQSRSTAIPS